MVTRSDTAAMTNEKRTYEAPVLKVEGKVKDLTLGQADGNFTDKAFPTNTPKPQLTFTN